jgi:hypothetical protein
LIAKRYFDVPFSPKHLGWAERCFVAVFMERLLLVLIKVRVHNGALIKAIDDEGQAEERLCSGAG